MNREKACPVVFRTREEGMDVLALSHPSAGKQFVKGTIESGELPRAAAERELYEESGLRIQSPTIFLGKHEIGADLTPWHFFAYPTAHLPDAWQHTTEDDYGHTFAFFWHPIGLPLDRDWHPIFHEAFAFFAPRLAKQ
jgi:8-oxo-dGTP pyrophosphatase MutT (NUDIX family)